jgi:hypothetical protein
MPPLPEGWESAVDATGRTYYINHIDKSTSWVPPPMPNNYGPPPGFGGPHGGYGGGYGGAPQHGGPPHGNGYGGGPPGGESGPP